MRIKSYETIKDKNVNEISMGEAEEFYSTVLIRDMDDVKIFLRAPLLVCMALHGRDKDLLYLLEKYPLLDYSGWTFALEEENEICYKSYLCVMDRLGELCQEREKGISIAVALAYSGKDVGDMNLPAECLMFSKEEKDWINRNADKITKYNMHYIISQQQFMKSRQE